MTCWCGNRLISHWVKAKLLEFLDWKCHLVSKKQSDRDKEHAETQSHSHKQWCLSSASVTRRLFILPLCYLSLLLSSVGRMIFSSNVSGNGVYNMTTRLNSLKNKPIDKRLLEKSQVQNISWLKLPIKCYKSWTQTCFKGNRSVFPNHGIVQSFVSSSLVVNLLVSLSYTCALELGSTWHKHFCLLIPSEGMNSSSLTSSLGMQLYLTPTPLFYNLLKHTSKLHFSLRTERNNSHFHFYIYLINY